MNSLYTRLASAALFPLHEQLKGHHSVSLRHELERSQWFTATQLQDRQNENWRRFAARIAMHVPWYRQQFKQADVDPATMTLDDLRRLPRLDKAMMREHGEQFRSDQANKLTRFNTGGSSGQPLIFYLGERISHDVAAKWRATRWWQVDIGDPELVLWGSPIEVNTQDRVKELRDKVFRTTLFPAFDLGEQGIQHFIARYQRMQPVQCFGYPSAFARVAQYAKTHNISLHNPRLKVCFVTAERLYDEQRQLIAEQFQAPVANGYGSRDAGFIAHECPAGGMHVNAEHIIVEILKADGSPCAVGEAGEITVTHLRTADYPFVRYRTGDVAAWSDARCACGRALPLLERIEGRSTDFVMAQDGTVMHGLALIYVVRDIPGVQSFRIVQHSLDHLEVMLVSTDWDSARDTQIIAGMRARLGSGVQVNINQCSHIPTEANGKYRYIISHVVH